MINVPFFAGVSKANPETKCAPSASSLLKKDDLLLFGSGSVSNLVVVSCLQCDALLKPAFLTHHINKVHGQYITQSRCFVNIYISFVNM